MINQNFVFKQFVIITLLVSIWINISEVFRYFVFVMPEIRSFFQNQSGIAEMNFSIFLIWGLWDMLLTTLLVFIFWLCARSFGNHKRSVLIAGLTVWMSVFVIFWVATANMGLSCWEILWITLPLSLLEMVVGAWIASGLYAMKRWSV